MRELLRHRDMRVYLAGQGLSLFGSMSLWLAAGIWVKTLTGSYGAAGMAFFCVALGTLAGPLSGLLVDRTSRRPLLIGANLAGSALLVPLLLVTDAGQLWLVYAVLLGYGTLHGLIASGQSALLVEMLPAELLPHANGALRTIQESLRLVSPLAGAGLFAWQGVGAVVLIDIAGFLAAAVSLLFVRHAASAPTKAAERFRDAVSAGLRHVARSPALRGLTIASAVAMSVLGFGESALFAVVEEGLGRPTAFLGVVMTAQGAGALLAGPVSGFLIARFGELRLAAAGLAGFAVGNAMYAVGNAMYVAPYLPAVLAGAVLSGGALPWLAIGATTLLQRRTPRELQGRVYSGFDLAITVPQTLSIAVGAALIGVLGYRPLLIASAAVMTLAALLVARVHRRDVASAPTASAGGPAREPADMASSSP